ncbi:hypothetical protein NPIL_112381, partial [Nephila pilipes]
MGISRRYANLMRKLICSDTIKWGRDIYIEHLSVLPYCSFLSADPLTQAPARSLYWDLVLSFVGL